MAFSEEEKEEVMNSLKRLNRAMFGDEDQPLGVKQQTDQLYSVLENFRAFKRLGVAAVALISGGAGAAIITFVKSLLGGGP